MFRKEKQKQNKNKTKKQTNNIKLDKLVVEKFPVATNFHDVIKPCPDRKSSCLLLFLSNQ